MIVSLIFFCFFNPVITPSTVSVFLLSFRSGVVDTLHASSVSGFRWYFTSVELLPLLLIGLTLGNVDGQPKPCTSQSHLWQIVMACKIFPFLPSVPILQLLAKNDFCWCVTSLTEPPASYKCFPHDYLGWTSPLSTLSLQAVFLSEINMFLTSYLLPSILPFIFRLCLLQFDKVTAVLFHPFVLLFRHCAIYWRYLYSGKDTRRSIWCFARFGKLAIWDK